MTNEALKAMRDISPEAVDKIKDFFRSDDGKDSATKADVALKLLGRLNGMESNRIKESALQFQVAKAVGMKGEELRAVLNNVEIPGFASAQVPGEPRAALEAAPATS